MSGQLHRLSNGIAVAVDPLNYGKVNASKYEGGLTTSQVMPRLAAGQVAISDSLAHKEKIHVGDTVHLHGSRKSLDARVACCSGPT